MDILRVLELAEDPSLSLSDIAKETDSSKQGVLVCLRREGAYNGWRSRRKRFFREEARRKREEEKEREYYNSLEKIGHSSLSEIYERRAHYYITHTHHTKLSFQDLCFLFRTYYHAKNNNEDLSERDLADLVGVTQVTIHYILKKVHLRPLGKPFGR